MAPRLPNIPPLTRALLLSLLLITLLNGTLRYRNWAPNPTSRISSRTYYVPYLTIIPGQSIIYPWVFVTATLAEQNLLGLLVTGATLFYGGRYLERAWSSREYSKFMLIIAVVPNILTFFLYFGLFVVTRDTELATTAISGGIAIQASYLVAFKQLVPEHTVTLFRSLISMRVKHFPSIFLLANTISGLLLGTDTAMLLAWCGFYVSWVYLRFYRISPSLFAVGTGMGGIELGTGLINAGSSSGSSTETIKGDASDTFAFASFWPDVIQSPIAAFSEIVYKLAVAIHVITPFSAADVDAGNEQANARGAGSELPGLMHAGTSAGKGRSGEAERRRALALRALDQRLTAGQGRAQPVRVVHEPAVARAEMETSGKEEILSQTGDGDERAHAEGVQNGEGEV